MKALILLLVILLHFAALSFAQTLQRTNAPDTVKDEKGTMYILDKERKRIKAINNEGITLWNTNPADDAKIAKYGKFIGGQEREIELFELREEQLSKNIVIYISYTNTQSGYIDLNTGKFHFEGQD